MKQLIQFAFVLLALSAAACAATAARPEVLKVVLDEAIQPSTAEFVARAIDSAQSNHDEAVLLELYTPGGLESSMRDIIAKILSSSVPVIVYVTPTGSRAASAGFYILESADVAAMTPGTNTGAGHPVLLVGTMDEIEKQKVENDAAAFLRSYVSKRGRNVEIAESGVRESKSFTEQEALTLHLIEYIAPTEDDLFKQLDGKTIKRFDGSQITLHLSSPVVKTYEMTVKQRIMNYLLNPNIVLILLIVGALALYVEFNTPGAVVPGVIGFIAILLAAFALNILPTSFIALGMILGAFALFGLEAKFQSHGVLTVGGIGLLILGSLMLVDGPIPEMRVKLATALAVSIPFGIITAFLMTLAIKARRNKVQTGQEGLIGEIAVVRVPLAPEGTVFVMGEMWNAVSRIPADIGSRVRVRAVHGLQLEVEPEENKDKNP
jgi:membrane-bound serine protease (ClpP class)